MMISDRIILALGERESPDFLRLNVVTDVTLVKKSGCSYDKDAIRVARKIEFQPAKKNGQDVSQSGPLCIRKTLDIDRRGSGYAIEALEADAIE